MSVFDTTQLADEPTVGEPREPQTHVDRLERLIWQHLRAVHAITAATHRQAARFEWVDLTPGAPTAVAQQVSEVTKVQGIGVINPSPTTVYVGWPGFSAGNGLGIAVAPNSYLRLPIQAANKIDVSCPSFGSLTIVSIILLEYEHPPELAAGSLSASSSSGGGGTTASTVTSASPRTVTVGTASTSVLAANATRKGCSVVNTGATNISLGLGATAIAGDDIYLEPGGSWSGMIGNCTWQGSITAISSAAGGSLAVVEV